MASTTKNAEHSAESPTPTAPAPGAPKAADGSARTQPTALEIPVTVNGARTVEGSDKREPFSESTKTVLIFNHGAVIRIATPVAAGQLVFLTNEKSNKEVVCQVVKSKPGPGAGYVELQFTEPAAGFWGMRFPTAPAAPPQTVPPPPRPTAPTVTRTTMPPTPQASPAAPIPPTSAAFAPPVTPKPAAPALSAPVPPKSAAAPPTPLPFAKTETPKPPTPPPPAPLSFAPPPAPLPPVAGGGPPEGRGIPEIHDYSKEIAKIFAVPPVGSSQTASTSSVPPAQPASSQPSTQDLKQQAAGLQVQLGSMLFTESPAAPPASRPVTPSASNTKSSLTETMGSAAGNSAQKAPAVKGHDAEPAPRPLPKPVPAAKSKAYDIEQVEEVKVPDWLAPLSRNAESTPVAVPAPTPASAASEQSKIPGWLAPLSHIAPPAPVPTGPSAAAPADVAAIPAGPSEQVLPDVEPEAKSDDAPFGG